MPAILWRVLIAVLCAWAIYALIPPVSHLLGFSVNGDLLEVVRICIAVGAVFFILFGKKPPVA